MALWQLIHLDTYVRLHIAGTNEPESAQQAKQGGWYKYLWEIQDTQSAQISQKQDGHNIYV